ncbi:MAG: GntR family transcriptional regulator [Lachnospiraceae bacterium]|nr:GntR family transcriptional regulator [Lachnospiraceae bacterium]
MGWSFHGNLPVYLQIASKIRADIISGKYTAEEQIPPVRQLAYEAAVNPNTMQRALAQLEAEGLLIARGTVGRFVTENPEILAKARHKAADELIEAFLSGCREMGFESNEIMQMLIEKGDPSCQF